MRMLKNAAKHKIIGVTTQFEGELDEDICESQYLLTEYITRFAKRSHDKAKEGSAENLIRRLMNINHHPITEFVDIIVEFTNVSRGFTHEMVRHRLNSFMQQSTRYVDKGNFDFVLPPSMEPTDEIKIQIPWEQGGGRIHRSVKLFIMAMEYAYQGMLDAGVPKQDARQFLPIGITAPIVVKANVRNWRWMFAMRCAKSAHWEIRYAMGNLLEEFQEHWPVFFDDFEITGKCKDGINIWKMVKKTKDSPIEDRLGQIEDVFKNLANIPTEDVIKVEHILHNIKKQLDTVLGRSHFLDGIE